MLRMLVSGVALSFAFVVGMAVSSSTVNEEPVLVSTAPSNVVPDETSHLLGCCTGDGLFCSGHAACQARGAGLCGAPCN
ncbi:MAG: hypothetical protein EOO71_08380 [Myxococcaceae bacterium]|nr:MAG: hypothetical protein EOO71_08380 [Myxococcaceae bacterium]